MGETRNAFTVLVEESDWKRLVGRYMQTQIGG
jgi:hypothetical protein